MKDKKKYIFVISLLIAIMVSCSNERDIVVTDNGKLEYTSRETNEDVVFDNFNVSIENIDGTWYLRTDYTFLQTDNLPPMSTENFINFDSMKEFKDTLTNVSFSKSDLGIMQNFPSDEKGVIVCDPAKLREISNLPEKDGYRQNIVEWVGGDNYIIEYQSKNQMELAVYTKSNEEKLKKYMTDVLAGLGTYEELQKNKNILNLKRTVEKTEMGEMEVCQFDTEAAQNYKHTYIEFTYNDIKYIISEQYEPNGTFSSSRIFVFNGDSSFAILNFDNKFTYKEIVSLKLSYVK